MRKITAITAAIILALTLAACGPAAQDADTDAAFGFTDDLGRSVTVNEAPQRVAALIGSFADVWCLAGGRDTLVAAADDAWTSFDPEPRGGSRQPRRDQVALAGDPARRRARTWSLPA